MAKIGFIGKRVVNNQEKEVLKYIGACLAKLGHTYVSVPTKGAEYAIRRGVGGEDGKNIAVDSNTIEASDYTFIYADPPLLKRLIAKYPDLETREDIVILPNLEVWVKGAQEVMRARKITSTN